LARLRRVGIADEPPPWAVLSAVGAGFLVTAIVEVTLFGLYPILFPPTREFTFFIPGRTLWEGAGGIAAGAVAMRAGGPRAVLLYVALHLATVAAQLPGALYSCRFTGVLEGRACDYLTLVAGRWPLWLAILTGVVLARGLSSRGRGVNDLLRAAGALGFTISVASVIGSLVLFLVVLPYRPEGPLFGLVGYGDIATYVSAVGTLVGCALAGVLLARRRLAAPLLLVLCLAAPSFANGVPLWRGQAGMPAGEPFALLLVRLSWFWIPVAGVLVLFVVWSIARRRASGTFS